MVSMASVSHEGKDGGETIARSLVLSVVALFFLWGGMTSLNDVLIPKLKSLFALSYTEAMLTQFAFFTAYFVVSLPAGHLIARVGYLKGIVIGLAAMAVGCLMFVPASGSGTYAAFLSALFVLAGGITILQVAANPLIANMGSASTASSRLTLAQAFNSLGTTVFPPIGGSIILGSLARVDPTSLDPAARLAYQARESAVIGHAYIGIAATFSLVAAYFWSRRHALPQLSVNEQPSLSGALGLLKRKRLSGGVACIFLYVGAEVSIGSMLINYLSQQDILGVTEQTASRLIALYWGGAMVGRFIGSWLLRRFRPGLVLAAFAIVAAILASVSGLTGGPMGGYVILAIGLANSIMFPTIFSLAVEGLGERTPQGSGLVCMGIVGGAIVPLIFGSVADHSSLAVALVVPALCYLLIAGFGWLSRTAAVA